MLFDTDVIPGRKFYRGRSLRMALTIGDLRAMAHRRLPNFVWEYIEGGAEEEVTLRQNREVFQQYALVHHVLRGVATPDLSVKHPIADAALPIVIAPTGFAGLYWREGDKALAKAAAEKAIPFVQSMVSNSSIEDVAVAAGKAPWVQLYALRSRDNIVRFLDRAWTIGSDVLVVTVDGTTYGNREWDRRNYSSGHSLTWSSKFELLRHPYWIANVLGGGIPGFGNLYDFLPAAERGFTRSTAWARSEVDPKFDWEGLRWLRSVCPAKLIVKGVMTVDDALQAVDLGADGIILSNHGGRQLDGAVSPMTILSNARRILGKHVCIMIDSGFRRGTDVVKALSLGADAILIGRAALYGLSAAGEQGVIRAIEILAEETSRTMAMIGAHSIADLNPGCLIDLLHVPPQEIAKRPSQ